jgi:lambda family phage portal protein
MNPVDRVISLFAPGTALKMATARKRLEILDTGYSHHGASRVKKSMLGWLFRGGSPDDDITRNIRTLAERTRDLYMGNAIANAAIKTAKTNVVGSGLQLNPQIDVEVLGLSDDDADNWERQVSREWALWSGNKNCDAARMCDFNQLQQLAFLSVLLSGDALTLLPIIPRAGSLYDLRVQLIEADRLCNPYDIPEDATTMAGVTVGDYGEPQAYYVAKYHPLSLLNMRLNEWTKILAFGPKTGRRNVLHLLDMERPGQRRGVPYLAPVIEALKQLGRYTYAELMAAVVSGLFTGFITTDNPEDSPGEDPLPGIVTGTSEDDEQRSDIKLGNGTIVELAPGEKIESVNPGRPNATFDPFVLAVLRQVGAALEIPMELLVKHFTASYSASRAALLEAWKFFRHRRAWLASDFCQPIYEEWLSEAVAKGRIKAPGFFADPIVRAAWCKAEWNGPSQGQLDPDKEVKAAERRVQNGFSTRARETAELTGGDFAANVRQRAKEEKLMREAGLQPVDMVNETIDTQGGENNALEV